MYPVCDVPRVRCPEHGVMTVKVPWSESRSRFTVRFEAPSLPKVFHPCTGAFQPVMESGALTRPGGSPGHCSGRSGRRGLTPGGYPWPLRPESVRVLEGGTVVMENPDRLSCCGDCTDSGPSGPDMTREDLCESSRSMAQPLSAGKR